MIGARNTTGMVKGEEVEWRTNFFFPFFPAGATLMVHISKVKIKALPVKGVLEALKPWSMFETAL